MEFIMKKHKNGLLVPEHAHFIEKFSVIKFKNHDRRLRNKPYDILEEVCISGINCLLNVGITLMWNLIIGDSAAHFDNLNAKIGVGSDATAADATQTDLQDINAEWASMDAGYPSVSGQTVTFSGTFADTEAEFHWQECAVRNVTPTLMNRVVSDKGTKVSGEEWVARLAITLS